jgi:DNA-binding transcriptional LysR family regulator
LQDAPAVHRRHQHTNIPTEIVRTVAVIAETGSFSKAADRLGLTQPAVSAQIKRLQGLIGGPVFSRLNGGLDFTPLGRLVLTHARKLLDANDQILSLGGAAQSGQPVRLGMSTIYAELFLDLWKQAGAPLPLHIACDSSAELARRLDEGFSDVACLLDDGRQDLNLVVSWREDFVWARSRDFVLSPGMPIPLVTWPGSLSDMLAIAALERAGLAYRVAFASPDQHARVSAAAAGIGLIGQPLRRLDAPLVVAREYYLPAIAPVRAGIAVRAGFDVAPLQKLMAALGRLAPPEETRQRSSARSASRADTAGFDRRSKSPPASEFAGVQFGE